MKRYRLAQIMAYARQLYKEVEPKYRNRVTWSECLKCSWASYKCLTAYRIDVQRPNGGTSTYFALNHADAYRMFCALNRQVFSFTYFVKGKAYEKKLNDTDRESLYFDLCGEVCDTSSVRMTQVHYFAPFTALQDAVSRETTLLNNRLTLDTYNNSRAIGGSDWGGLYGSRANQIAKQF